VTRKRSRLSTLLLLIVIAVLVCALVAQQRKEARLRAALALYKSRSHEDILTILSQADVLDLSGESTLAEVIARIKVRSSRRSAFPRGVPIYVDPISLRSTGQSLSSPVNLPSRPVDGLSLRESLRLILHPLGLAYRVKDGSIIITVRDRDEDAESEE
jgi:hypothetical protein